MPPSFIVFLREQKQHVGDIHFKSENVLGGAEVRNFLEIMLQNQNIELLARRTEEMMIRRLASEMGSEKLETEVVPAGPESK